MRNMTTTSKSPPAAPHASLTVPSQENSCLELDSLTEVYHEFVWTISGGENKVRLVGSWDDWQWESPMQLVEGRYRVLKALEPGTYEYKYVVNGEWKIDERQPITKTTSGYVNNTVTIRSPSNKLEGSKHHALDPRPLIPCTFGSSTASFLSFGRVGHFPPDFLPSNSPVGWHLPEDLRHITASPPLYPLHFEAHVTSPTIRQTAQSHQNAVRWSFSPSDLSHLKQLICYVDLPEVQFIDSLVFEFGLMRPWTNNWTELGMAHSYSLSICYHSNSGWIDYARHYPITHLLASSQDASTAPASATAQAASDSTTTSRNRRCGVNVGIRAQKLCIVFHEDADTVPHSISDLSPPPSREVAKIASASSSSSSLSSSSVDSDSFATPTEAPKLQRQALTQPVSAPWRKQFAFSGEPFDQNGLLYWLGTNEGREAVWENPALTGKVGLEISHSKMTNASMSKANVLARQTVEPTFFGGTAPTFFTIDLGSYYRFSPSSYTIRHGHSSPNSFISDWSFQASNDGHDWVTLHSQVEPPFTHGFDTRSFEVPQLPEHFRYFRILMKGNYSMIGHTQAMAQIWAQNEATKESKAQRSKAVQTAISSENSSSVAYKSEPVPASKPGEDLASKTTKPDIGAPFLCIAGFEMYGELSTSQQKPSPNYVTSMGLSLRSMTPVETETAPLVFDYGSDFDTNGILYFLSTNGGTDPYVNPSESGLIQVSLSHPGVYSQSMSKHNIVAHNPQTGNTFWGGTCPQWFMVDLRSKRVKPTAYTLRHGFSSANSFLRDWEFAASNDASTWVTLHSDKPTPFNKGHDTDTWTLTDSKELKPFRYFRVLQRGNYYMGPDSSNPGAPYMCIAGFELYGELSSVATAKSTPQESDKEPASNSADAPADLVDTADGDHTSSDFVATQMRRMNRQALLANTDFHLRVLALLTSPSSTPSIRIQCLELLMDIYSKSLIPLAPLQANLDLRSFFRYCLLPLSKVFQHRFKSPGSRSGSSSQEGSPSSSRSSTPPTPTAPAASGGSSIPSKESLEQLSGLSLRFLGDVLLAPRPTDADSSHSTGTSSTSSRSKLASETLDMLLSAISSHESSFDSPHTVEVIFTLLSRVWEQNACRSHSTCTVALHELSELLKLHRSAYYNILRTHYKLFDLVLERRLFFYQRSCTPVLQSFHSEDPLNLHEQSLVQLERTLSLACDKFEKSRLSLCTLLDDISSSSKPYSAFQNQVKTLASECARYQTLVGAIMSRIVDPTMRESIEASLPESKLDRWEFVLEKLLMAINAQCGYRTVSSTPTTPSAPKHRELVYPFSHSTEYLMEIFSVLCVYASPAVRVQAIRFLAPELGTHSSFPKTILASLFSAKNSHDPKNIFDKELVFKSVVDMLSDKMRFHFSDQLFELIASQCSTSSSDSDPNRSLDSEMLLWTVLLLSHLTETNNEAPHPASTCRACNTSPIRGTRYRCVNCVNYDICEQCEIDPTRHHDAGHIFVKIDAPLPLQPSSLTAPSAYPKEPLIPDVVYDNLTGLLPWVEMIQNPRTHTGVTCDSCGTSNIVGCRFKCCQCENFNLCEACDQRGAERDHLPMHLFLKIWHPLPSSASTKALIPILLHRGFYPAPQVPLNKQLAPNPSVKIDFSSPSATTELSAEMSAKDADAHTESQEDTWSMSSDSSNEEMPIEIDRHPCAPRARLPAPGMRLSVSERLDGPSATTAWSGSPSLPLGPRDSEANSMPVLELNSATVVQSAFIERKATQAPGRLSARKMSLNVRPQQPLAVTNPRLAPGLLKHSRTEENLKDRLMESHSEEESRWLKKETLMAQKRQQTRLALQLLSQAMHLRPVSSDLVSLTTRIIIELAKQQDAKDVLEDAIEVIANPSFVEAACALDPAIQSSILMLVEEILSGNTFLGHGVQEVHIALRSAIDKLEAFLVQTLHDALPSEHVSSSHALIFVETHSLLLKLLLGTGYRSAFYRQTAKDEVEELPRSASVTASYSNPIAFSVVNLATPNSHVKRSGSTEKISSTKSVITPKGELQAHGLGDAQSTIPRIVVPRPMHASGTVDLGVHSKAPHSARTHDSSSDEDDSPRVSNPVDVLVEPLLALLSSLPLATFADAQHWAMLTKLIGSAGPAAIARCSLRFIAAFRTTLVCTAPYQKVVQAEMSAILYTLSDDEEAFAEVSVHLFETLMRETALRLVGPAPVSQTPSQLYLTSIEILHRFALMPSSAAIWTGYPTFAAETARLLMAVASSLSRQPRSSPSYTLSLAHAAIALLAAFLEQPSSYMSRAKADAVALLIRQGSSATAIDEAREIPIGAIATYSLTPEERSPLPIAVFLTRLLALSDTFTDAPKAEWNQFDDDLVKFMLLLAADADQSAVSLAQLVFGEVTSPFLTSDSARAKLVKRLLMPMLNMGEKIVERFASADKVLERLLKSAVISEPAAASLPASFTRSIALEDSSYLGLTQDYGASYARQGRRISTASSPPQIDSLDNLGTLARLLEPPEVPLADMIRSFGLLGGENGNYSVQATSPRPIPANLPESWKLVIEEDAEDLNLMLEFQAPVAICEIRLSFLSTAPSDVSLEQGVSTSLLLPSLVSMADKRTSKTSSGAVEETWIISSESRDLARFLRITLFGTPSTTFKLSQLLILGFISGEKSTTVLSDGRLLNSSITRQTAVNRESYLPIESALVIVRLIISKSEKFAAAIANNTQAVELLMRLLGPCNLSPDASNAFDAALCSLISRRPDLADQVMRKAISGDLLFRNIRITQAIIFAHDPATEGSVASRLQIVFERAMKLWRSAESEGSAVAYSRLLPFVACVGLIFQKSTVSWEPGSASGNVPLDFVLMMVSLAVCDEERLRSISTAVLATLCQSNPAFFPIALQHVLSDVISARAPPDSMRQLIATLAIASHANATHLLESKLLDSYIQPILTLARMDLPRAKELGPTAATIRNVVLRQSLPLFSLLANSPSIQTLLGPIILEACLSLLKVTRPATQLHDKLLELCSDFMAHHPTNTSLTASIFSQQYLASDSSSLTSQTADEDKDESALRILHHFASVQPMVGWSLSRDSHYDDGTSDPAAPIVVRHEGVPDPESTLQRFCSLERTDPVDLREFRVEKQLKLDETTKTITNANQAAGWRTAICSNALAGESIYYWEITLTKVQDTGNVIIGVCEADHSLSQWIGQTSASRGWSYHGSAGGSKAYTYHAGSYNSSYGKPIKQGDVVGVLVDLVRGELSFFHNGQPLGVAYQNLTRQQLFPAISLIEPGDCARFSTPIYVLHSDSLFQGPRLIAKRLPPNDPRLALRLDSASFGFVETPALDATPELLSLDSALPEPVLKKKHAHPTYLRPIFESPPTTKIKDIKNAILAAVPSSAARESSKLMLCLHKPGESTGSYMLAPAEDISDEMEIGELWRRTKPSARDSVMDLVFSFTFKSEEEYDEFSGDELTSVLQSPAASNQSAPNASVQFISSLQDLGVLDSTLSLCLKALTNLQFDSKRALVLPLASAPHGYIPVPAMSTSSLVSPVYRDMQLLVLASSSMREDFKAIFKSSPPTDSPRTLLHLRNNDSRPTSPEASLGGPSSASDSKASTNANNGSSKSESNADEKSSNSASPPKMPFVRVVPIGAWISFLQLLRPLLTVEGYFALFRESADPLALLLQILSDSQTKGDTRRIHLLNGFDSSIEAIASKPVWNNPQHCLLDLLQERLNAPSIPVEGPDTPQSLVIRNAIASGPVLTVVLSSLSEACGLPPRDLKHPAFKKTAQNAETRRGLAEKLAHFKEHGPDTQPISGATSSSGDTSNNSKKSTWAKGTGYGSISEDHSSNKKKQMSQEDLGSHFSVSDLPALLNILVSLLKVKPISEHPSAPNSPGERASSLSSLNSDPSSVDYQPALCPEAYEMLLASCLVPLLDSLLRNDSLLDMGKQFKTYTTVFQLTELLMSHKALLPAFNAPISANHNSTLRSAITSLYNVISAAQKKLSSRHRPSSKDPSSSILAPVAQAPRHGSLFLPSITSPSTSHSPSAHAKSSLRSSGRIPRPSPTPVAQPVIHRRRRNSSFHGGSKPGSRAGSVGSNIRRSGSIAPNGSRSGSVISNEENQAMDEQSRLISWVMYLEELAANRIETAPQESVSRPEDPSSSAPSHDNPSDNAAGSYSQKLEEYIEALGPLQFDEMEMSEDDDYVHHYYRKQIADDQQSSAAKMKWLTHEIGSLAVGLPLHLTSSVFLRVDQSRIDCMKVAITGPSGTPYDSGLFIFDLYCPPDYPKSPPLVNLQTTGLGSVRFNPNLYNNGKVCLSLLGTWPGGADEMWREGESTLLQVFVSIQSLIFIDEPYFNEPGFEAKMGTSGGRIDSNLYNETLRIATLRWAILEHLRSPPLGFETLVTEHFKHRRIDIMKTCRLWLNDAKGSPTTGHEEKLIKLVNEVHTHLQALEPFEEVSNEEIKPTANFAAKEAPKIQNKGSHRDARWRAAIALSADFSQFHVALIHKALEISKDQQNEAVDWLFENGEKYFEEHPSLKDQSPPEDYDP